MKLVEVGRLGLSASLSIPPPAGYKTSPPPFMFWPPLIHPPLYLLYQLQLCQGWLSPTSKLQLNPEPGQCGVLTKAYYREAHSGPLDTLVQYVGWVMQGVGLGPPIAPRSLGEMTDLQIGCQSHLLTQRCLFTVAGVAACPC